MSGDQSDSHGVLAEADRVERFEPAGEPEWTLTHTLHGVGLLPLRVVAVV